VKFALEELDCPFAWTITPTLPGIWLGVTARICEGLETLTDVAAAPPKVTVASDVKFAPLIVTVVPPEIGPDDGEMPLTTGVEGAPMLMLRLAVAVLSEESFAWTENENVPACDGVPEICPVDD
jgi:hypothetical protein